MRYMEDQLNLISKPMQVYNCDETGVSVLHKPGKVVAELGHRNVYAIASGEKGKTHTVLSCALASGYIPESNYHLLTFVKELLHTPFLLIVVMAGSTVIYSCNGLSSSCNISHQLGQCCSSWMGMGLTCQLTSLN